MVWYDPFSWFQALPECPIFCANPQCPEPIITDPEFAYNTESRHITHFGECQWLADAHTMLKNPTPAQAVIGNYETIDRKTALKLLHQGKANVSEGIGSKF
ncbi:hypothetical protein HY497_00115 [Candidatus Woesearchaeota archaeon]|nr:hypothetical protein [Candidatus Woesearchaeota archaeon]